MGNKSEQVGCGYCCYELLCIAKQSNINLAKAGCPCWRHFDQVYSKVTYNHLTVIEFKEKFTKYGI